jgi:chlorophyllide a reductase subunit X
MTAASAAPALVQLSSRLRAEASQDPAPVHTGAVKKETQIIAIYGKGGIGKSFTLANLSYMMAQQGKRVLLIGCDPKSDTTSLLFGGKACPTIIETSSRKKLAGEDVTIADVCFKRDGVFAMELGGPEVGRGCGGRGIIHGFETLEKLGFHDWGFDYVLLDFLGDVVCGGFGLPIARDMCQKVIVVGSNDLQSLYVPTTSARGRVLPQLGGNVGVAGLVDQQGRRHGRGAALRRGGRDPGARRHPRARRHPAQERQLRDHRPPGGQWGPLFEQLATAVGEAPPKRPRPLSQDALLGLFSAHATGRDVVLEPATLFDMCGREDVSRPSLEVVYDTV